MLYSHDNAACPNGSCHPVYVAMLNIFTDLTIVGGNQIWGDYKVHVIDCDYYLRIS